MKTLTEEKFKESNKWFWVFISMMESLDGRMFHKRYALNAAYTIDSENAEKIIHEAVNNGWEIEGSMECNLEDNKWLFDKWRYNKEKYNIGELRPNGFLGFIDEVDDQDEWSYEVPELDMDELISLFLEQ